MQIATTRRPSFPSILLDRVGGIVGTVLGAPIVAVCAILVWSIDRRPPFYVSERIGLCGRPFRFIKIRTMIPNAAANQVDTTVNDDPRILPIGRFIRALKLDELPQFWHVLAGTMSLVGPRPNVLREVTLYTTEEREMLSVRPGITDYASIVFADLASALDGRGDPNIAYNQLVRPVKSALSLHYLATRSFATDVRALLYTVTNLFARRWTLGRIAAELRRTGASSALVSAAARTGELEPLAPPGAIDVVTSRERHPTTREVPPRR